MGPALKGTEKVAEICLKTPACQGAVVATAVSLGLPQEQTQDILNAVSDFIAPQGITFEELQRMSPEDVQALLDAPLINPDASVVKFFKNLFSPLDIQTPNHTGDTEGLSSVDFPTNTGHGGGLDDVNISNHTGDTEGLGSVTIPNNTGHDGGLSDVDIKNDTGGDQIYDNSWQNNILTSENGDPAFKNGYVWKPQNDVDLRGTGKTFQDALEEAFNRTGYDKSQFKPVRWSRTEDGKSIPVEYWGPNGSQVNVDVEHTGSNSLGVPHIGYQVGTKGKQTGHILVDDVPANRYQNQPLEK